MRVKLRLIMTDNVAFYQRLKTILVRSPGRILDSRDADKNVVNFMRERERKFPIKPPPAEIIAFLILKSFSRNSISRYLFPAIVSRFQFNRMRIFFLRQPTNAERDPLT